MSRFISLLAILSILGTALAFPSYGSLAGLTERELDEIIPTLEARDPESPPGPMKFTGTKLVNDPAHPWKPAGKNDIRGPCPGLNTLASHGVRFHSLLCMRRDTNHLACFFLSGFLATE